MGHKGGGVKGSSSRGKKKTFLPTLKKSYIGKKSRGIPPKKPARLPKEERKLYFQTGTDPSPNECHERPTRSLSTQPSFNRTNHSDRNEPYQSGAPFKKEEGEGGEGGEGGEETNSSSSSSMYLADVMTRIKSKMQGVDEKGKQKKNGVTIAVVGSSGCGKTTMIKKIFLDEVYSDRGENKNKYAVIIFTESPKSDALRDVDDVVAISKNTVDPEIVKYCYQMNLKWDKEFSFVVLLDDCLDIRHKEMIQKMFLTMRNMNVTSLVSLQYLKIIPPSIRTSVYFTFLFSLNSDEGIEQAVRGWLSSYLEGKSIRGKMDSYRSWTCSGEGHCFYLVDNLNHKCYAVDENYECRELPQVSSESGMSMGPSDPNDPYCYNPKQERTATDQSLNNYFSMCDRSKSGCLNDQGDQDSFYNNLFK